MEGIIELPVAVALDERLPIAGQLRPEICFDESPIPARGGGRGGRWDDGQQSFEGLEAHSARITFSRRRKALFTGTKGSSSLNDQ